MTRRILFIGRKLLDESVLGPLGKRGFVVIQDYDDQSALQKLIESRFDLVIVNLVDSTKPVEIIERIRSVANLRSIRVLVLGEWGRGQVLFALSKGADAYEPAPIDGERLATSIARVLSEQAVAVAGKH